MRLFGSIALAVVVLGLPASASAKPCGQVVTGSIRWQVKVERGNASCGEARRIIHKLYTGKERGRAHGEHHDPPRDLAETFWVIDGWKCEVGAGGGGCIRGGKSYRTARGQITADVVPSEQERTEAACQKEGWSPESCAEAWKREQEQKRAERELITEATGPLLEGEQECWARGGTPEVNREGEGEWGVICIEP